jgi:hypothetical protein
MNTPDEPRDPARRAVFRRVATYALGASVLHGIGVNRAFAQAKVPQKAVAYQGQPKGEQRCDGCSSFQPPNACKLVDGKIDPQGWCSLFMKKS